jgi:hypothetical protein
MKATSIGLCVGIQTATTAERSQIVKYGASSNDSSVFIEIFNGVTNNNNNNNVIII